MPSNINTIKYHITATQTIPPYINIESNILLITPPYIFNNLIPGISYTYTIKSYNAQNILGGIIATDSYTYALAASNLQITYITSSNIFLTWTAGIGASYYKLQSILLGQVTNEQSTTSAPSLNSPYCFSNLATSNTSYYINVTSYNTHNQQGDSISTITGTSVPSIVNFKSIPILSNVSVLLWDSYNPTSNYLINANQIATLSSSIQQFSSNSPYYFSNINDYNTYNYTLNALNSQNIIGTQSQSSISTYRRCPTNFQVDTITPSNVTLVWSSNNPTDNVVNKGRFSGAWRHVHYHVLFVFRLQ